MYFFIIVFGVTRLRDKKTRSYRGQGQGHDGNVLRPGQGRTPNRGNLPRPKSWQKSRSHRLRGGASPKKADALRSHDQDLISDFRSKRTLFIKWYMRNVTRLKSRQYMKNYLWIQKNVIRKNLCIFVTIFMTQVHHFYLSLKKMF